MVYGPKTQIAQQAIATNQTIVIYTVPAGKKFYLSNALLHITAIAVGFARIVVRNAADTVQRSVAGIQVGATTQNTAVPQFQPVNELELLEGWDIAVISSIAGLTAEGNIFGHEVSV